MNRTAEIERQGTVISKFLFKRKLKKEIKTLSKESILQVQNNNVAVKSSNEISLINQVAKLGDNKVGIVANRLVLKDVKLDFEDPILYERLMKAVPANTREVLKDDMEEWLYQECQDYLTDNVFSKGQSCISKIKLSQGAGLEFTFNYSGTLEESKHDMGIYADGHAFSKKEYLGEFLEDFVLIDNGRDIMKDITPSDPGIETKSQNIKIDHETKQLLD